MNSALYKTSAACKVPGQLLKMPAALCFLTGRALRDSPEASETVKADTVDFVVRPSGH